MNNKGNGSELALILLLVVALLVAWLVMTQFSSLGIGGSSGTGTEESQEEQDPVDAAKDAVDQYNQALDQRTECDD